MSKMTNEFLLKVDNLSVNLDGQKILENISFEIKPQEVLAVIGPNGAGKTVLLKTLAGMIPITKGKIDWAPNIQIGYLPQRFNVDKYLPMTVKEFFNLKLEIPNKMNFEEVAKLTNLTDSIINSQLAHLSAGQTQKVLLAWAILNKPRIILFDEPTENIDPVTEESIYQLLHYLQDKLEIALIIVSHDLNVVYKYATSVLCLNKKMLCYGEPFQAITNETLGALYGDHAFFHHQHFKQYRSEKNDYRKND